MGEHKIAATHGELEGTMKLSKDRILTTHAGSLTTSSR